ncbi:MAG: winged helix-turn-helix domain-containing protein [Allorhizobium sp.]
MTQTHDLHFGALVLDESCLSGRRKGEMVQFTKSERALLLAFCRNPRRLMSRNRLLDAIATSDAESSDRNIDFLINRLRAKIGDNARSPSYIATQYGEGYVWIAEPSRIAATKADTFLAIAPPLPHQGSGLAWEVPVFVEQLHEKIANGLGPDHRVAVVPPGQNHADISPRYLVRLSFHHSGGRPNCTATLQEMPAKRVLKIFKPHQDADASLSMESSIAALSGALVAYLQKIMNDMTAGLGIPPDLPLEERLWSASKQLSTVSYQTWLAKGEQLGRDRELTPSADTALQWCMHLFSRLVVVNPFLPIAPDERDAIESEMEEIALQCLPAVENNPVQMLAVAKMLYFVNRGHLELAQDIAERGAAQMPGSAAALPLLAQIYSALGKTSEALALLDRGLDMSGSNFEFFNYLSVLKCIALLAAADTRRAAEILAAIDEMGDHCPPDVALAIGLMAAPMDKKLAENLTNALVSAGSEGAGNALDYLYFTSARHHASPVACANVMRVMTAHVTGIYGEAGVPAFLRPVAIVPKVGAGPTGNRQA